MLRNGLKIKDCGTTFQISFNQREFEKFLNNELILPFPEPTEKKLVKQFTQNFFDQNLLIYEHYNNLKSQIYHLELPKSYKSILQRIFLKSIDLQKQQQVEQNKQQLYP